MTVRRAPKKRSQGRGELRGGGTPEVLWTERALADIEEIGDHIARDQPVSAARWVENILRTVEEAAPMPHAGRRVPELGRDDLREVFLKSYRIVYQVTAKGITVVTVFEGHRLFPEDVAAPAKPPRRKR